MGSVIQETLDGGRIRRTARTAALGLGLLAAAISTGGAEAARTASASFVIGNDAPAWSPDGSKIAFTSFRHGKGEIYVINADGTQQTRLTSHPSHDDHPAWSPDGTQIAFMSTRSGNDDIWVMNADGSGLRQLTTDPASDFSPTWSPDGQRIAWRTNRDGNPEIYSMLVGGGDVRRLTDHPAADESPSWGPDGRIAFSSSRSGGGRDALTGDLSTVSNIFVMHADGSGLRQVTSGRTNDTAPNWSPDGSRLLFVTDRHLPLGNTEVYVVNSDGTGERRLTTYEGRDDWPDWSPDGTRIALSRGVSYRAPDVYVGDANLNELTQLTETRAQLEVTDAAFKRPRAGELWSITVHVRDARGLALVGARQVCRAMVAGKLQRPVTATLGDGLARCAWRLPPSARGTLLRGAAGVRMGPLRAEVPFGLRVR